MKKIFENQGIELLQYNERYYLRYDVGELMIKVKDLEITNEEAQKVIDNPELTYNVIVSYHDKGIYGNDI